MRNTLIVSVVLLALTGCGKESESSVNVRGDFVVEKLFTYEGCTMHRFVDQGNYKYYTNCGSTQWREACGKNCSRDAGVMGVNRE